MNRNLLDAPLFRVSDRRDVRALAAQLRSTEFPVVTCFFEQGQPGDRLYLLVAGRVKLCRQARGGQACLFAVVGPPDMFGELSVFDPGPHSSSAIALTVAVCG